MVLIKNFNTISTLYWLLHHKDLYHEYYFLMNVFMLRAGQRCFDAQSWTELLMRAARNSAVQPCASMTRAACGCWVDG